MRKWILPLACVASLSACGMFGTGEMDQTGSISTGGGASNEVLDPETRTPATWPEDQRPYTKSEQEQSSGSSGKSGQTSGASDSAPEVIIVEPIESAPSTSGASGMNSGSSSSDGLMSGSDSREPEDRTPAEWPTDQRPYIDGKK